MNRRMISAALVSLMLAFAPAAQASQDNLYSPTTGAVSGLALTNNYNNALKALASCNSGATAPSNLQAGAVAGQCWLDTSTTPYTIKLNDGASNWAVLGYLDATNHIAFHPLGGGTANVASNSTTDLWSVAQNSLTITGTTTITAMANSSAVAGTLKVIKFASVLTLTHNATSMILPTAADITTAAGDYALVLALTSTNVAVVSYHRADGTAVSATSIFTGSVHFNGIITPSALASNTDDWSPTGLSNANTIRVSASGPISLTGLVAPVTNGKLLVLQNVGTSNITLLSQSSSSTAANRFAIPGAHTLRPNQTLTLAYDATTARWRLQNVVSAQPIQAGFKTLLIVNGGTPNNQMALTADALTLEDTFGEVIRVSSVSVTADVTSSGANGLDTGTVTTNTWYALWVIYNPTTNTVAGLFSISSTTPTMPSGYTFKARYGWARTDASSHFKGIRQSGRLAQYVVGTNNSIVPTVVSGIVGTFSTTSPTLSAQSVASFVPSTASMIGLVVTHDYINAAVSAVLVAPNVSYGGSNNGPRGSNGMIWPYAGGGDTNGSGKTVWFALETTTIGLAIGSTGGAVGVLGWEDNI